MDCPNPNKTHEMFVTPFDSDSAEFKDSQGKLRTYVVVFDYGRAEVPDNLGRWMVDHGLAKSSRIILPAKHLIQSIARA